MVDEIRYRGVYGCFVEGELIYVGSSGLGLEKLAYNHRNWQTQYGDGGRTNFRFQLTENEKFRDNEFRWLIKPAPRTLEDVETLEGQLIRSLEPLLNIDKNPVASSKKYGRY